MYIHTCRLSASTRSSVSPPNCTCARFTATPFWKRWALYASKTREEKKVSPLMAFAGGWFHPQTAVFAFGIGVQVPAGWRHLVLTTMGGYIAVVRYSSGNIRKLGLILETPLHSTRKHHETRAPEILELFEGPISWSQPCLEKAKVVKTRQLSHYSDMLQRREGHPSPSS